jgi:hypothetical protein
LYCGAPAPWNKPLIVTSGSDRREGLGGRLLPALDKAAQNWLICP